VCFIVPNADGIVTATCDERTTRQQLAMIFCVIYVCLPQQTNHTPLPAVTTFSIFIYTTPLSCGVCGSLGLLESLYGPQASRIQINSKVKVWCTMYLPILLTTIQSSSMHPLDPLWVGGTLQSQQHPERLVLGCFSCHMQHYVKRDQTVNYALKLCSILLFKCKI